MKLSEMLMCFNLYVIFIFYSAQSPVNSIEVKVCPLHFFNGRKKMQNHLTKSRSRRMTNCQINDFKNKMINFPFYCLSSIPYLQLFHKYRECLNLPSFRAPPNPHQAVYMDRSVLNKSCSTMVMYQLAGPNTRYAVPPCLFSHPFEVRVSTEDRTGAAKFNRSVAY